MTMKILTFLLTMSLCIMLSAEVITDGSLGARLDLAGPNFQVKAALGQQRGSNLFHSFQTFNLQSHETATFSAPDSVRTVISRVTGNQPSLIDGLIRSTIPQAAMYFLNPKGILFGPHAQLDVPGHFHASTADYLRLADGGRFDVRQPSNSALTVAPVEAFGFLTNSIAGISIQGIGEVTQAEDRPMGLNVSSGKTLSIIAGDIEMTGSYYRSDAYIPEYRGYIKPLGNLIAPSGRINLASVASKGVVIPTSSTLDVSTFSQLGRITLTHKSLLEVSGFVAGRVFIRADQLLLSDASQIFSNIRDYGESIFPVADPDAHIDIALKKLSVIDASWIAGYAFTTTSDLGDIRIQSEDIQLRNGSWINSQSYTGGDTGNISIKTDSIHIENGGIGVIARDTGDAGRIHIQAIDTISVVGADSQEGWSSGILSITTPTNTGILGGVGGDIILDTQDLVLKTGAQISSSTIAGEGKQSQDAGHIKIQATGTVQISGVNPYGENENGLSTGIYVRSQGDQAGDAGTISLTADALSIREGGIISASTSGHGQGGHIYLDVHDTLTITGDSATVVLQAPKESQLKFRENFPGHQKNRVAISGIYGDSFSHDEGAGEAGTIKIAADQLVLTKGATINTATQKASGGDITITTPHSLYLQASQVTTSVQGGIGDGGNIHIENPALVILNKGQIKARAEVGHGGNIHIIADQFVASTDSLIDASSKTAGLDGHIRIESPEEGVSDNLGVLFSGKLEVNASLKKSCSAYAADEKRSYFRVDNIGTRPVPHDQQGSPLLPGSSQVILKK